MEIVTGKWVGFYDYNTEDGSKYKARFTIAITDTDGVITGECVDSEEDGANPEPANIRGFIKGNLISFIKQYPHYWFFNEDGAIEKIMDRKHPEIHYSGRFIGNIFIGSWEMEIETLGKGEGFISKSISGKWQMAKK